MTDYTRNKNNPTIRELHCLMCGSPNIQFNDYQVKANDSTTHVDIKYDCLDCESTNITTSFDLTYEQDLKRVRKLKQGLECCLTENCIECPFGKQEDAFCSKRLLNLANYFLSAKETYLIKTIEKNQEREQQIENVHSKL